MFNFVWVCIYLKNFKLQHLSPLISVCLGHHHQLKAVFAFFICSWLLCEDISRCLHGWSMRYKDEDEATSKCAQEAYQDMLDWFIKYLKWVKCLNCLLLDSWCIVYWWVWVGTVMFWNGFWNKCLRSYNELLYILLVQDTRVPQPQNCDLMEGILHPSVTPSFCSGLDGLIVGCLQTRQECQNCKMV